MTTLPGVSPARQAAGIEVEDLVAAAYTIPTDRPESDGTLAWDSTTIVVVEVTAGPVRGIGYAYAHPVAAEVATTTLARAVVGRDVADISASWTAMVRAVRNVGRQGIAVVNRMGWPSPGR